MCRIYSVKKRNKKKVCSKIRFVQKCFSYLFYFLVQSVHFPIIFCK